MGDNSGYGLIGDAVGGCGARESRISETSPRLGGDAFRPFTGTSFPPLLSIVPQDPLSQDDGPQYLRQDETISTTPSQCYNTHFLKACFGRQPAPLDAHLFMTASPSCMSKLPVPPGSSLVLLTAVSPSAPPICSATDTPSQIMFAPAT